MKITHKFIIFCMVGIVALLIDWSIFNLFYFIGINYSFSLGLGVLTSMIFNFSMNRNYTFNARGYSIRVQIVKWLSVYGIAFLARLAVGNGILFLFGETILNVQIAFFAGIFIAVPIDFLGSLFFAFRKKK